MKLKTFRILGGGAVWRATSSGGSRIFPRGVRQLPKLLLLPPANEDWGKVIFLHPFVILFTGGGGLPQCMPGYHLQDTPGAEHAGRYGQRAGGTHPAGMQSCFSNFCQKLHENERILTRGGGRVPGAPWIRQWRGIHWIHHCCLSWKWKWSIIISWHVRC